MQKEEEEWWFSNRKISKLYLPVGRSGGKFQSPVSRCKFHTGHSLSGFRQLRFCRPSGGRRSGVGAFLKDLGLVVRTAGGNETPEFGMAPAEHADAPSMGLPFADQTPFPSVRQIPDADEAIATAGSHAAAVNVKGAAVDVILVHGGNHLRRRRICGTL